MSILNYFIVQFSIISTETQGTVIGKSTGTFLLFRYFSGVVGHPRDLCITKGCLCRILRSELS